MLNKSRSVFRLTAAVGILFAVSRVAEAGPPLICHPFDAGSAPVLQWKGGPGWKTPDPSYDMQQLTGDVLRLLSPEAPILARMENMRRATIYAAQSRRAAAELLAAVLARTAKDSKDPLAWFDAGYLVESYRQAKVVAEWDMLAGVERDGYSFVKKAIALAGASPDMDFAASLMQPGAAAAEHRRRAEAGAKAGSLLAKNLNRFSL